MVTLIILKVIKRLSILRQGLTLPSENHLFGVSTGKFTVVISVNGNPLAKQNRGAGFNQQAVARLRISIRL
jgi:hypothetical protein